MSVCEALCVLMIEARIEELTVELHDEREAQKLTIIENWLNYFEPRSGQPSGIYLHMLNQICEGKIYIDKNDNPIRQV